MNSRVVGNIKTIGPQLRSKEITVLDCPGKTRSFYTPQIMINGSLHYLRDENTKTKMVECKTREEARSIAKKHRDELADRLGITF